MTQRDKLIKELMFLRWEPMDVLDDAIRAGQANALADFILADRKRIVEPLKYTLEKFDSIHTKIERQSYSFVMANDIRRVLANAGLPEKDK